LPLEGFEVKAPRASVFFWKVLRLGDDFMSTWYFLRKFTPVFCGDVAG
jgi:uncharacterized membrane protein YfbV (UPF0208 family)